MSWSLNATGFPVQVIDSLRVQIERYTCPEPESLIRRQLIDTVTAALCSYSADQPVEVIANGSQSKASGTENNYINQMFVSVKPLWGFLDKPRETAPEETG